MVRYMLGNEASGVPGSASFVRAKVLADGFIRATMVRKMNRLLILTLTACLSASGIGFFAVANKIVWLLRLRRRPNVPSQIARATIRPFQIRSRVISALFVASFKTSKAGR